MKNEIGVRTLQSHYTGGWNTAAAPGIELILYKRQAVMQFRMKKDDNMNQLPYELHFMHKFNLHKLAGLLIKDPDIGSIARVYGVEEKELREIEDQFRKNLAELADELRKRGLWAGEGSPCIIAAIGNSITSDRESWAKILNELWKDVPNRYVIDCAISGDTTCHIKDRFYSSILNQAFDRAVLFIGTNDCRELDDEEHISNISHEEYMKNMRYFIDTLQGKGKEVVVVTIPYVDSARLQAYFPDANQKYSDARIDLANAFLRELAREKGTKLADLAAALKETERDVLEEDGIHLNSKAQLVLCELLIPLLA